MHQARPGESRLSVFDLMRREPSAAEAGLILPYPPRPLRERRSR